jgi:hypothetical protein
VQNLVAALPRHRGPAVPRRTAWRGALPYFIDWLLENVHLVEITAYSDDDAYTIFETMNDRGLSLSPTDMLKGYLLANIDEDKRTAPTSWRDRIRELNEAGKEVESDCFKAWLRSQHATKIRERKKGAKPEDFDRIGTEFHRWLRDAADTVGLKQSDDFYRFIDRDFDFYSRQYLRLWRPAKSPWPVWNTCSTTPSRSSPCNTCSCSPPAAGRQRGGRPQNRPRGAVPRHPAHLAAVEFPHIAYSTMQYAMFVLMRDIRGKRPDALAHKLHERLGKEGETFASNDRLRDPPAEPPPGPPHPRPPHRLRGDAIRPASRYLDYVSEGKTRYEVEHIWADHPERHTDEFCPPRRLRRAPQPHRRPVAAAQELQRQLRRPPLRGQAAALQHPEPARPLAAPTVLREQPRLPQLQKP